ncbi:asparagine synthase [Rhizoctonia solani AG-1 IA]|uniref:asparagine synthase (glutamine-hydrolyzing) n=1 Tax=Thanatephorus cucumeris (strain AG1-IA) TaxID=983506 RepID=L8X0R5_THACA|nr:asparagine synthase [Rhizoctonia solani AG-1 IA]
MCGIFAIHGVERPATWRTKAIACSKKLRHRGPDWSGCYVGKEAILVHERLLMYAEAKRRRISDTGAQPLVSEDGKLILAVNGEIYNYIALRKSFAEGQKFKTHSDCEVILHLVSQITYKELCNLLDGMFSFVLLDESVTPTRIIAARDPIGITTLYQGRSSKNPGAVYFASELKALVDECDDIISFPPGHVYDSKTDTIERYFKPTWWDGDSEAEGSIPTNKVDLDLVRTKLEEAVRKRLMSEVPYGVLLSGGLDSSLIAAIAARETEKVALAQLAVRQKRIEAMSGTATPKDLLVDEAATLAAWPQLHSFSIGLPNSPDLLAARKAAAFLGTVHHEYTFTVQEGLDAIPEVIYHLETYDVTTVRASTPMYLLSRKIKAMGVKMVLSGEGSDEIFGGYLYFHAAPTPEAFHQECVKRVKNLHTADCLRANKSTMAWGLEARVPFLDKEFLEVAMNIDPKYKTFTKGSETEVDEDGKPKMEKASIWQGKYMVTLIIPSPRIKTGLFHSRIFPSPFSGDKRNNSRMALDTLGSTGKLHPYRTSAVTDEAFANRHNAFPEDTPDTKEGYFIREVFQGLFPTKAAASTAVRWIPRGDWGCASDPSGRSVSIHNAAYTDTD